MTSHQTIHATFSAIAGGMRDAIAVLGDDPPLSYGELDDRSNRIAGYLRQHGVGRGDRVGLYAQRGANAVAAMLGILKAGAVYVPFDPSYPHKLLAFVYADSAPSLMLVQASLLTDNLAFWEGSSHDLYAVVGTSVAVLPADIGNTEGAGDPRALPRVGPDDPAYLMYTSGSTGHPKGVLIPHRGVLRLVIDNPFADMGPEQTHLQLAPLAFDASTFEIWGALLNGGRLAIVPAAYPSLDDIADAIARHGVTTLWLTAGLFHLMVDHRLEGLRPLRQLIAGGDVLSPRHVAKAQQGLPECQLINGYGPTENTTFTCCYRIPRRNLTDAAGAQDPDAATARAIPIGTPIAHTVVHILDEFRAPVADGEEGELYAGGSGVALGYWNRPELTAERFVADAFDASGRGTLYRTGDRVRRRADGNIEFLGRVDRQIKVNGKRVELDEIESCLRRSALVEDAAVIDAAGTAASAEPGTRKIHAYVKFRAATPQSIAALRDFVRQELPDYMMPATFTAMDTLPLSPTGKIERSKLPPPRAAATRAEAPKPASANAIEEALLEVWRTVLGKQSVQVDDNFFDLGGTSLQLLEVHARITTVMQNAVTLVELFQYPRISLLAQRLKTRIPVAGTGDDPTTAGDSTIAGAPLNADERAQRQRAALSRARNNLRRQVR